MEAAFNFRDFVTRVMEFNFFVGKRGFEPTDAVADVL
jgi:hypothetical protein